MPGGDGTGPLGTGPMGGRRGYCGAGPARGMGRGFRQMGCGRGRRFRGIGQITPARSDPEFTRQNPQSPETGHDEVEKK